MTAVGTTRLRFTNGESATLEYDYLGTRVSKPVTRQVFASTVPSCLP